MDMLYFRVLFFFAIVFFLGQESAERRGQGCNANQGYDKALIHQSIYRSLPSVRLYGADTEMSQPVSPALQFNQKVLIPLEQRD